MISALLVVAAVAIVVGLVALGFGVVTLIQWERCSKQNTARVTAILERLDSARDQLNFAMWEDELTEADR